MDEALSDSANRQSQTSPGSRASLFWRAIHRRGRQHAQHFSSIRQTRLDAGQALALQRGSETRGELRRSGPRVKPRQVQPNADSLVSWSTDLGRSAISATPSVASVRPYFRLFRCESPVPYPPDSRSAWCFATRSLTNSSITEPSMYTRNSRSFRASTLTETASPIQKQHSSLGSPFDRDQLFPMRSAILPDERERKSFT